MTLQFTDEITCKLITASASDLAVVNAARVSFDQHHEALQEGDDKLIAYLVKNRHGSPFEHGMFSFEVEAPIFVFREHHRHRAGHSYNEVSGRYTELKPKFYVPRQARVQEGKPGHYTFREHPEGGPLSTDLQDDVEFAYAAAWNAYQTLLAHGVAKEQARIVLPVGLYTKMIWTCNPRSLMHFLSLRKAPSAMKEIRQVASLAETAFIQHMPITYQAFVENERIAP